MPLRRPSNCTILDRRVIYVVRLAAHSEQTDLKLLTFLAGVFSARKTVQSWLNQSVFLLRQDNKLGVGWRFANNGTFWNTKFLTIQINIKYWSCQQAGWAQLIISTRPVYAQWDGRNRPVMGGFLPLWEGVARLSLHKSDSVIKPKGLGGSVGFPGAVDGSLAGLLENTGPTIVRSKMSDATWVQRNHNEHE